MRNHQMPNDGLKTFSVRRDVLFVARRNDHACVGNLGSVAAAAADDSDDLAAGTASIIECGDDVETQTLHNVAAADRQHEDDILCSKPAAAQPLRKDRFPTVVVGAGGQLEDIVGRRVRLYVGDLAKVVDGVRRVSRAVAMISTMASIAAGSIASSEAAASARYARVKLNMLLAAI